MTVFCQPPDVEQGVALRLSTYLDCQAQALGQNGFQAVTSGPAMAGLLSALVAIFVALIGYRLILGAQTGLRDGVGWAIRLGIVLALVTSWPAFQTLIYQVVTDGPTDLSAILVPASGLSAERIAERVQAAYDRMRQGTADAAMTATDAGLASALPAGNRTLSRGAAQLSTGIPALPQTASLFVMSTSGVGAALRLATGFLIAVGPIAILGLLFAGSATLFDGWLRAVVGVAFGNTAASVVTAIEMMAVESEFGHALALQANGDAGLADPQAMVTIVLFFAIVMLVTVVAALRIGSAIRLPAAHSFTARSDQAASPLTMIPRTTAAGTIGSASDRTIIPLQRTRASAVADSLAATVQRETYSGSNGAPANVRTLTLRPGADEPRLGAAPIGLTGRRGAVRQTRSSRLRDASR